MSKADDPDSDTLAAVIADMRAREALGKVKYGTTVDRADFETLDWMRHAYEEALDLALYLKRAMDYLGKGGEG